MKTKISTTALTLMFVCTLLLAFIVPVVYADKTGIGKYLTVEIVGEGYVIATKVKSGETWRFDPADPPMTEKVGAGTVELEAFASDGWEFSEWGGDLSGSENPTDYKTVKYGEVTAVFIQKSFTITASAEGNGDIDPVGDVIVESGESQTFTFIPDTNNHVSAIVVDGDYQISFAESYTFNNVIEDHTIVVYFSEDGTATVPAGTDVTVFLASGAGLTFDDTDGGVINGEEMERGIEYPFETEAVIWDITITITFTGEFNVTLQYDDTGLTRNEELDLRLIQGDSIYALRSDVNNDLVVDGTDVSIVANAIKEKKYRYDPALDLNNDELLNEEDVHIVNENKGTILEDITDGINTDLNIIWGTTDHNGIFGVRGHR
jgi:hypothetical protein